MQSVVASAEAAIGRDLPQSLGPASLISVANGVATIDMSGPMIRKAGLFEKLFMGAVAHEDVASALREAGGRADVSSVFLNIDSPGGTVMGTPELAAEVAKLNATKPVYAFTSGMMGSAAYWVGSQATAIYATPSARVGSIGAIQTVVDQSAMLERLGIKVEVFSVGKFKSAGHPAKSLTDEQRQMINESLAEIVGEFRQAVSSQRSGVPAEAMEGQTFSGKKAQEMGLATIVADQDEAMRRLSVYRKSVDKRRASVIAIEDQLATAQTQIESLQSDGTAQAELLTEASAAQESLRAELATSNSTLASVSAELETSLADLTAAREQAAALSAEKADFDSRVQSEVARIAASTGTSLPAGVTAGGSANEQREMARADFNKLDHSARNEFIRARGKITE